MTRPFNRKNRKQFLEAWDRATDNFKRILFAIKLGEGPVITTAIGMYTEAYREEVEKMREITGLPSCIQMPTRVARGF